MTVKRSLPDGHGSRESVRIRRLEESTVKKKALGLAAFLIVAASILNAFFGEHGVLGLMEARREHQALQREVEDLEVENQRLAREIQALRTDPLVVERLAREVLGMAKPGEISVVIRTAAAR